MANAKGSVGGGLEGRGTKGLLMTGEEKKLEETLLHVARFYNERKVGDAGHLGFRRSSDLSRVLSSLKTMNRRGLFDPGAVHFLDLGCADGRVNVLTSYLAEISVGIEIDDWILDEHKPLAEELALRLAEKSLLPLPHNIFLYHGDSLDESLHDRIRQETGVSFNQFDVFYTYLTMHEEFGELIARKGKPGAVFMVYGPDRILPHLKGFRLLTPHAPLEGIVVLYQKI